jgi:hypothetical protein
MARVAVISNPTSNDQPTCSGSFSTRSTRPWLHTADVDLLAVHTSRVIGDSCAISRRHGLTNAAFCPFQTATPFVSLTRACSKIADPCSSRKVL